MVHPERWGVCKNCVKERNGLVIFPIKHEHQREDEHITSGLVNRITTLDVTYRIQNIDDKEDYALVVSTGTAADTQDKGIGKAMTYAYKYMAMRTFAIESGADPDHTSSEQYNRDLAEKTGYQKVKKTADIKFTPPSGDTEPIEPLEM